MMRRRGRISRWEGWVETYLGGFKSINESCVCVCILIT